MDDGRRQRVCYLPPKASISSNTSMQVRTDLKTLENRKNFWKFSINLKEIQKRS